MTTSTQCQHGALRSGCGLCKDARITELETEVCLRGEAIAVLNKALASDSKIVAQRQAQCANLKAIAARYALKSEVAQWQAQYATAQEQIKRLREALEIAVWRKRPEFPDNPFCVLCGAGKKWAVIHGHEHNCALATTAPVTRRCGCGFGPNEICETCQGTGRMNVASTAPEQKEGE